MAPSGPGVFLAIGVDPRPENPRWFSGYVGLLPTGMAGFQAKLAPRAAKIHSGPFLVSGHDPDFGHFNQLPPLGFRSS